jgi:Na+/proline symporter
MHIALPMNEAGKMITDRVFPNLALNHLGSFAGLVFIIGLTAATFSSADSVLTTLTTSTYVDMLELDKRNDVDEKKKTNYRHIIHIGFAVLLLICILIFYEVNSSAVIKTVLIVAGYTYGPLLGLFSFGMFCKRKINDNVIPVICLLAPALTYVISYYLPKIGYDVGNELILLNGGLTFAGLWLLSSRSASYARPQ